MQAGAVADIGAVVENCDKALNDAEKQAGVSARGAIIGIAGAASPRYDYDRTGGA